MKRRTLILSVAIAAFAIAIVISIILFTARQPEDEFINNELVTNELIAEELPSADELSLEGFSLLWSLAEDPALQSLAVGDFRIGDEFDNISPALIASGDPLITAVSHAAEAGQIGLQISQREEDWHTIDIMFSEVGIVLGGAYRFVAQGRIEESEGSGGRGMQWNQTDPPWSAIEGSHVQIPDGENLWKLDITLDRYQIGAALNGGQRGLRLQTNYAPSATIWVDDVFVYQVGEIDTEGLMQAPQWDMDLPSLASLFEPYFALGNIYSSDSLMQAFDTQYAVLHHFNAITAENAHKPDHIAGPGSRSTVPTPEEFNFADVDTIVNWAIEHEVQLVGHVLVWHGQSPDWLYQNPDGTPLRREEAKERMEFYIRTLSEHFAEQGTLGAFYSWDVVNEAIASDGGRWRDVPGNWRSQMRTDSPWMLAFANGADVEAGEDASDFIWYAFHFARKYFPYSILYYNDYNEEVPAKRNAIAQMVEEINEMWKNHPSYDGRLLIEAIGMQSHYHLEGWRTNLDLVPQALDRFIQTGARVSITELDITFGGSGSAAHPYLNEDQLERQAAAFERIFGYYLERANYIGRVSIWGIADHKSWRSNGFPLLFNDRFEAKPAFYAIVNLVENWGTPTVTPPTIVQREFEPIESGSSIFTRLEIIRECNAPVWFSIVSGELPPGVILHSRTGVLEGVLEGVAEAGGTFSFVVEVRNYGGSTTQEMVLDFM